VAPYIGWNQSIGCILNSQGESIKDSECYEWKENSQYYDIANVQHEHKTVIFLGFLVTVFGHVFIDNLRKIWFTNTDFCKKLLSGGAEFVYTTSWNNPLPGYVINAFNLAGFDITKARRITSLIP
jgi:hypothetical protein